MSALSADGVNVELASTTDCIFLNVACIVGAERFILRPRLA